MNFPDLIDLATTNVHCVAIDAFASEAVESIFASKHRNAIICKDDAFYIFGVNDILHMVTKGVDFDTRLNSMQLKQVPTMSKRRNVLDTLELISNGWEHIVVVNDDGSLYGIITHTDITSNIDPDTLMENYKLQDFLKLGRRMKWVDRSTLMSDLLQDIALNSFDNAIIVDALEPVGIITTKDVMRLLKEKASLDVSVENYMTSPVETISKESSIKEALDFLNTKNYKRVVVVDADNKLNGVITQKELISLTYSRWAVLMKKYQRELRNINKELENKTREYERQASTDPLTGLYNRYKFAELFNSSYQTMVQRQAHMSLIMVDIDHFKQVNDTYGHNVGDVAIIQVAHALLRNLRNIDVVCRWGGEEFVALLPTANLENALVLAEKIRLFVANLEIDVVGKITASFGVSEIEVGKSLEENIAKADKALYLAKEQGRNRVEAFKED